MYTLKTGGKIKKESYLKTYIGHIPEKVLLQKVVQKVCLGVVSDAEIPGIILGWLNDLVLMFC